jgi:Fe2+ or Zn2+ uptake regulation protein
VAEQAGDEVPTDRELQALKVLWEREGTTVREVCEAMREQGTDLAYTTVLSLLQVMEQKGMVRHEAAGKTYRYVQLEPTETRRWRGWRPSFWSACLMGPWTSTCCMAWKEIA